MAENPTPPRKVIDLLRRAWEPMEVHELPPDSELEEQLVWTPPAKAGAQATLCYYGVVGDPTVPGYVVVRDRAEQAIHAWRVTTLPDPDPLGGHT